MQKVLVVFKDNYCDEFDVYGFWVTTEENWIFYLSELGKCDINENISIGFGTNEDLSYNSFASLVKHFQAHPISNETYNELSAIFRSRFGTINILSILEIYQKYAEEDEEWNIIY